VNEVDVDVDDEDDDNDNEVGPSSPLLLM